jgi:hypothetical protein
MKRINYEIDNEGMCYPFCEHDKTVAVGSEYCRVECDHNMGDSIGEVMCGKLENIKKEGK